MRPKGRAVKADKLTKHLKGKGRGHYKSLDAAGALFKSLFVPKGPETLNQFKPSACPPGATHCGALPAGWLQALGKQPSNVAAKSTLPGSLITNPNLKIVGIAEKSKMLKQLKHAVKLRSVAGLLAAGTGALGLGALGKYTGRAADSTASAAAKWAKPANNAA